MASITVLTLADIISQASKKNFLKKAIFSKSNTPDTKRVVATLFSKSGTVYLQLEYFMTDGKALHKNINVDDVNQISEVASGFAQINVIGDGAEVEYKRSKGNKEIIIGEKKFLSAIESYGKKIEVKAHNRIKAYTFDGSEPFMYELGIADKNGRIYDKKQAKFRQINRFIEHVADIYKHLPYEGKINVLDLCCGKSYLSFAVYHYLTVTMNRDVDMIGIDLKEDVIEFCGNTAENLGYSGLHFHACNINDFPYASPIHLVVSLHACDIATDIVLTKAIELGSKVILSTPCCQKELLQNISTDAFSFITKYPALKKKLCDALTDALRLERLKANGYDAIALEFTDPDDTPKNILLRAIKISDGSEKAKNDYQNLCASLVGDKNLFIKG